MKKFQWFLLSGPELNFLAPLKDLIPDFPCEIRAYLPSDWNGENIRRSFDGIWTLKIEGPLGSMGIVYSDFKIFGGSFGVKNSARLVCFLDELNRNQTPLFMSLNTIGVRIMEGRQVFPFAFKIIPALIAFARRNLLITSNHGKCLGLGALLYVLGHYRFALKKSSQINLTGPEVFKMFFGVGADFAKHFNSENMQNKTSMVHEIHEDSSTLYRKIQCLAGLASGFSTETETNEETKLILDTVFDGRMEVFGQKKGGVLAFIARRNNVSCGVLINPVNKGNMVDNKTINKYRDALSLFRKLSLPLISFVDTPGADPRVIETENDIIKSITELTGEIIEYPHDKIGVTVGRCYGGASVLMIPTIYGGKPSLALKGSHMGIMGKQIIRQLLSGSQRFLEMWEAHASYETEMRDLLDLGLFEGEYNLQQISAKISDFLIDTEIDENIIKIQNGIQIKIPTVKVKDEVWKRPSIQ